MGRRDDRPPDARSLTNSPRTTIQSKHPEDSTVRGKNDADSPADQYFVGGAGLPSTLPGHEFPYPAARRFQRSALEWINSDGDVPPVSAIAAPTGGGKTAVIAALAEWAESGIICTYPTNALVEAQANALEEIDYYNFSVQTVSGRTLSGSGAVRSQELTDIAQTSDGVIVTNPDVLQAILQGAYFSPGKRVVTFFEQFDAAVFDEFHYYDPLAASGLLMQIRALAQRGQYLDRSGETRLPRFLLTSATPDEEFVTSVTEDFGIDAQIIRSRLVSLDLADPAPRRVPAPNAELIYTPAGAPCASVDRTAELPDGIPDPAVLTGDVPDGVSRFRSPMVVNRWSDWIGDSFDRIAETLKHAQSEWEVGDEPLAAVVFNSAARSNAFDQYLYQSWPDLAAVTRKDNGYDTNADSKRTPEGQYAVLNTTSKGEVGLDFDLERLIVSTPRTATALIQRIGRAARRSPATVDIYGLDDPTWPPVQSYAGFLARILEELPNPATSRRRLRELAGMRAARAIQKQIADPTYDPDLEVDFESIPGRQRWKTFLRNLEAATDALDGGLGAPTVDANGRRAILAAQEAAEGLDALRGRSVKQEISYPTGGGQEVTEYDITRALRHYPIAGVQSDGVIRLGDETPTGALSAAYPGEPFGGVDLRKGSHTIENQLTDAYCTAASEGDFRQVDVDSDVLEYFFRVISLQQALLPTHVDAGRYRLGIDQEHGKVERVDDTR
ncbi:type I-D CRISPR-associated helicase Cas3' [Halobellus sp. Atlit-31R]|nr:type I-D CRISPR-associated helicase Cas3' [Halobellus sp. Atlit-31R]